MGFWTAGFVLLTLLTSVPLLQPVTTNICGPSPLLFLQVVKAMMVFWTAGFVLLTLLINAPLLPTVLRLTGLSKVPDKQLARRQRAVAALGEHTATVLEQLRDAEDELLAGGLSVFLSVCCC